MSRLLPISVKSLQKVLEKLGFKLLRQKGSHIFYRHEDGRTTVVPNHTGEKIGKGLLRKILNDVDISKEEFDKQKSTV